MSRFLLLLLSSSVFGATLKKDKRIADGQPAGESAFPYLVSIRIDGQHECAGSILDATTILTAAHCLFGFQQMSMTVTAGSITLDTGGDTYEVSVRRTHEFYDPYTTRGFKNDIGILKLKTAIKFSDKVQPIRYLAAGDVGVSVHCILPGWGITKEDGDRSNELRFVNLLTIPTETCSETWLASEYKFSIDDRQLCTFTQDGQGACRGDSGGPLIVGTGLQIGIASMALRCGIGPNVYTKVAYYRDWIERNRK
ncbi:chymotrypsin-1-like [Photinus pyralis]|uniref:chymotrypsin-1-like n=1 Tax=Photinus pyralis TaxID=7054 RepID=UPI0012673675|nr:chymotrypsin-1-like [Photinus pyralis]